MIRRSLFAGALLLAGCTPSAPPKNPPSLPTAASPAADVVANVAHALVDGGCDRAAAGTNATSEPVPTWREPAVKAPFDVVMYTAHPDDEAMYAGGTMDRLVRGGHHVAFVTMSHGEGGRLLERARDGSVEERRDYPRSHVVEVRDREIAEAARQIGVEYAHLHPAEANLDDVWTTSCSETVTRWQASVPGGIAGILHRLVADIRARRPRVIITLDPRDDPQSSHHGHHKAVGVLVDAAVRLAADPLVTAGGAPHVVEELLTTAPQGQHADVEIPVSVAARLSMLTAYGSQFVPEKLAVDPVAQRKTDAFVLRWRATGAPVPRSGTRLMDFVGAAPVE